MEFEFDPNKSENNNIKHGIDFVTAQSLWKDIDLIEISTYTTDELRKLVIGKISRIYWTGVITYRNEKIRIISVRKSRKKEIEIYESR